MSINRHPALDVRTRCSGSLRRTVVAISSLFLLVATVEAGPDDKAPPASTSGARVLFDGKSLEDWKKCDFYKAGEVKVEDGLIIMSKGVSMSGITSTRQDLPTTNYELSYEAMRLADTFRRGPASRPAGTSRWASPPGNPPAHCVISRSGRSRRRKSPRLTSLMNDEGCEEMQLISGRFGHLATGGWGSMRQRHGPRPSGGVAALPARTPVLPAALSAGAGS